MLPFASALAVFSWSDAGRHARRIDLSVAGGFSLYVVILTKYPAGDNDRLWAALVIAFLAAIAAGLLNGLLIGRLRLDPIVATLGTNALLFESSFCTTAGIPTTTTARLHSLGSRGLVGHPSSVFFAVAATAVVTAVVKLTPAGRRFEGLGQTRPRRSRRAFECSAAGAYV